MIETIVGGLVLAAISGLAWLAYKHPRGYRTIKSSLEVIVGFVVAWLSGYFAGFIEGHDSESGDMPFSLLSIAAVYLAIMAYLIFLALLPRLTNEHRRRRFDDDPEEK